MISTIDEPRGAFTGQSSTLTTFVDSCPFRAVLLSVLGVPERFPRLTIPGVRLRVRRQHSRFWLILTRFEDYYSPFWGPEAISIVVEPQGLLMCQSSTLKVLGYSGPFRGLLLTVLGSRSDFDD